MCGIIGIAGTRDVSPLIVDALKRLEYRGYDSAGVATLNRGGIDRRRSPGKLNQLAKLLDEKPLPRFTGIGHTRWATHGAPTERNAHPHISGGVCVVHNGIIENHDAVRERLRLLGYEFDSDTDTEVIAHLVHWFLAAGLDLFEAVQETTRELQGAYAIAVICSAEKQRLVVARMGAPLLLGL